MNIRQAAYIAVMQNVATLDKSGNESLLTISRETDPSQEEVHTLSSIFFYCSGAEPRHSVCTPWN